MVAEVLILVLYLLLHACFFFALWCGLDRVADELRDLKLVLEKKQKDG